MICCRFLNHQSILQTYRMLYTIPIISNMREIPILLQSSSKKTIVSLFSFSQFSVESVQIINCLVHQLQTKLNSVISSSTEDSSIAIQLDLVQCFFNSVKKQRWCWKNLSIYKKFYLAALQKTTVSSPSSIQFKFSSQLIVNADKSMISLKMERLLTK